MQATTVRSAFVVVFSRLAAWWNDGTTNHDYPADFKLTDALERDLCEREMRRALH